MLLGYIRVQSHSVHFTTSDRFLFHSLIFLDTHLNHRNSSFEKFNIVSCPQTSKWPCMRQYMRVLGLLDIDPQKWILTMWTSLVSYPGNTFSGGVLPLYMVYCQYILSLAVYLFQGDIIFSFLMWLIIWKRIRWLYSQVVLDVITWKFNWIYTNKMDA